MENGKKTNWIDQTCLIIGVGLTTMTVVGFLGRLFWVCDLFSHFRVQYFQLFLVLIGVSIWRRQNKQMVVFILLACLNYALVLPLYFGKPSVATEPPARAMLMNLNASNGNSEQVLTAIRTADPDLLLLEEVTPKWAAELGFLESFTLDVSQNPSRPSATPPEEGNVHDDDATSPSLEGCRNGGVGSPFPEMTSQLSLALDYPYRVSDVRNGCFGIMLLSKHPLSRTNVVFIGSAGVPTIVADVHLPQGEISLIGTHPVPPISVEFSNHRNHQLTALPDLISTQKYPVLLIGDLNASPWSAHFGQLLKDSGLKNSMKHFGFQPSWPSDNRFFRIPIDHILHSPDILIHRRAVGGDVGSDHLPVIVDFSIR